MFLSSRRYFAGLIFSLLFVVSAYSQTLYWVGASGNFNDPNHWSLTSGGSPAGIIPGPTHSLVFDNNIFDPTLIVTVSGQYEIEHLSIETYNPIKFVSGSSGAKITSHNGFRDILDNLGFQCNVDFEFKNNGSKAGLISTGRTPFYSNMSITGGRWQLKKVLLLATKSLSVSNSDVEFLSSYVNAGNITVTGCSSMSMNKAYLLAQTSAQIDHNVKVTVNNSYFNRKAFSGPELNYSAASSKFSNNNQTNATCVQTLLTRPSCSPGCDGTVVLTIPNFTCFTVSTPTAVFVSVDPGTVCAAVAGFSTTVPGTFTLTGFCNCGNDYNIFVDDESLQNLEFFTASVVQPNIAFLANPLLTRSLTCNGVCTGSAGITAFGGTAPYTFSVYPPQTASFVTVSAGSISQSSLCAGTLSIFVRDNANCTQSFTRNIVQPPAYNSNSVATNIICNSACDGGFTIAPSGGTANYTVNLSTGGTFTAVPNQVFAQPNLCPGPVSATVTDKNNCKYIASANITEPSTIIIQSEQKDISCGGACSGVGQVTVTGGGGSYNFSWSPNPGTASVNPNLCASTSVGIHTVTITDIPHGCVKTQTFFINEIAPLTLTGSVTHVTCNSASTGVISATVTGGTTPRQFTIINASNATVTTGSSSNSVIPVNNLPADTYTMFISDANSCTIQAVFTLTQTPAITLSAQTRSNTCPTGPAAGAATLIAGGGNGGFTYIWIAGNTPFATGLTNSVYPATINDAASCPGPTISVSITGPLVFNFGLDSLSLSCNNSSLGVITSTPSNGTGPYSFTLASSSQTFFVSNSATATFSNLPGSTATNGVGTYTLFVGDDAFPLNCPQTQTISLIQPAPISPSIAMNPVTCNGACNGTLSGSASGGSGTYTLYTWVTPSNTTLFTQQITNQCADPNDAYTLTVTDSRGCVSAAATATLTEPLAVQLATVVVPVSCHSLQGTPTTTSNGQITTTLTGGTPPYNYNWNGPGVSGATSTSVSNLPGGTYTLVYGDNAGCTFTTSIPVQKPASITVVPSIQGTTCQATCNGTVSINVTNGQTPFNYQFAGSTNSTNSTGVFNNVCSPPNFTVTVTDGASCQQTTTGVVPLPPPILKSDNLPSVSCFGICDGLYTVTPTTGIGPYSFNLAGPTNSFIASASSATFSNLCGGNYVLTITDIGAATCGQTFAVSVDPKTPITPNASSSSTVSCSGTCDGSYSVSPSGGTGVFPTIVWNSAQGGTVGAVINGRCANEVHSFTITDNNNCSVTGTVAALTAPLPITIVSQSVTHVTCFNGSNGAISFTPTGGPAGGYTYSWSPGAQTTQNISGLGPGAYQVTVTAGLCSNNFPFNVNNGVQIVLTNSPTPVKCFNDCNGVATISVTSGGISPFSYSINGTPSSTNSIGTFSNLCAGSKIGQVTDAAGCVATTNFTVNTPQVLSLSVFNTKTSCAICSGSAAVTATGGNAAYSYTWASPASTISTGTNSTVQNLCPNPYTVTVSDNNSCTATTNLTITPVIIVVGATPSPATCFNANNGTASVQSVSGGAPAYNYSWSANSSVTTPTIGNLPIGTHTVFVSDQTGPPACVGTATFLVTQPSSITITGTTTPVSCPGVNDGAINTTISGGPGGGTTTYFWSPSGLTTQNIASVGYSLHVITVSMTNGPATCTASQTFSVGSPDPVISATLDPHDPTNCPAGNNGSICVQTVTGGNISAGYQYLWMPGSLTSSCITGLTAQNYSVTITSSNCSITFTASLDPPVQPTLSLINKTNVACNSASTGAATFSSTGTSPFSFTWSPGASSVVATNSTTGSNLSVPSGTVQIYTVTVADNNNCMDTETVSITQPASITVNSTITNVACNSASTGVITLSTSGGTPGTPAYNYTLSTGATLSGQTVTFTNLSVSSGTSAVITVTVRDGSNCTAIRSFTLTQPPVFSYTNTEKDVQCFGACNGSIAIIPTNGTGLISYSWSPLASAGFTGSTASSISSLCPGVYTVSVTDANGCVATGPTTFNITEPVSTLTITTSVNHNITCFGNCNGAASFTATGGTSPYTYSWSTNSSTTTTASSLCLGQHIVTAFDQNSCVSQSTISITGPTAAIATTLTATQPLCPGAFNGSITTQIVNTQGNVNYSWTPVGTGQNPTGLSAGGTGTLIYTLTVTDDSSCVHINTVTLIDPAAITSSVVITASPTCFGDCDGSATANFSNAVGSTTVTWLPMNTTSASIVGLCSNPFQGNPNIYSVTVVDSQGCRDTLSFVLNNPTQIGINSTVTPAQCGPDNGSITVSGTGGTPGYQFLWLHNGQTSLTQSSLSAGVYTVVITDANSCSVSVSIPVASINGPTAVPSPTSTSLLCNAMCTGSIGISAISPSNALVSWLAPIPSSVTSTSLTNLCAGTYTVELNDTLAKCKNYYSFTISQPNALTTTSSMTEPTCFGVCDGSLGVVVSGGTPTYNLLWTGPNGFTASGTPSLTNICGGVFTLNVTDQNTCGTAIIYNVPVLNNIVIQQPVSVINNNCYGECNGSATVNVVNTTTTALTATVNWSNSQSGNVATGLCAGMYSVLVTDTRGCSNTFNIPITSPSSITLSSNVVQPNCNRCDGSAVVTASGGNGPAYTYSWTTGDLTSSVTDLCAGLYQVVVSDNLNCQQLHNVTINSSNGFNGDSVIVKHEDCGTPCSGAATITPLGGASPITYNWLSPGIPGATTTASNLCAGQYFVQMRDANNCIRTTPFTINPAATPTVSAFIIPPDCGVTPANGVIQLFATGLTGPATYSWAPLSSTSGTLNNLGTGVYTVVVTDNNSGCSTTKVIALSNATGPAFTANEQDINCAGQTGSIGIVLTSTGTVTYSWSTGATGSGVSGLPAGPVTVTITDNNGCKAMQSFTIDSNTPIESAAVTQGIFCNGDCNGIVTLLPVGGTLPYTYTWSPENETTLRADSLCAGVYTIIVADSKGCRDTSVVDLVSPIALTSTVNTKNSTCSTIADGSASINAAGGLAPYTYSWTGPGSFVSGNDSISNILPGTYTVVVTDSLGCKSAVSTITVPPTVILEANAGRDTILCPLNDVILTGSNSIGAISYTWITEPSATLATTVNHGITAVETQTFYLVVTSTIPGCIDRDTVVVNVHPTPFLDAGVNSYTIPVRSTTVIGGNPTSLIGGPTHTWAPSEYLSDPLAQNPVTNNTINVTFTVSINYGDGCMVSDTVQVLIQPEVRITSGFSPNGDGKNDTWIIDYIEKFPSNSVEIYNRWGDQVFYSIGYFEPFDGNYKGQKLPVGTYYYVIKLNHESYPKPYTGPLTIFR